MSVLWQQSTHGVPRRKENLDRMTTRLFLAAVAVATLLIGAYLALSASTVKLSNDIWQLHMQMAQLQRENSRLETEIAQLSAIPVMQQRSTALGYQPASAVEYVYPGAP